MKIDDLKKEVSYLCSRSSLSEENVNDSGVVSISIDFDSFVEMMSDVLNGIYEMKLRGDQIYRLNEVYDQFTDVMEYIDNVLEKFGIEIGGMDNVVIDMKSVVDEFDDEPDTTQNAVLGINKHDDFSKYEIVDRSFLETIAKKYL